MDDSVPKPLLQDSSFTTLVHRKALNMTFFLHSKAKTCWGISTDIF